MFRDLLHLVTARADALLAHVPGALDGDARDTHQARVGARRFAEVLALTGDAGARLRRDIRALRRGLGATREIDVARHLVEAEARRFDWPPAATNRLRRYLDEERDARQDAAGRVLSHVSVSRLRRHIRDLGADVAAIAPRTVAARVRARVRARERAFITAVRQAGALYDVDKLHAVRIAGKKLRYTLEIGREALGQRSAARIESLKRQQRLLGELHDTQVLEAHIRELESRLESNRGTTAMALAAMRDQLDAECRRLHANWLSLPPVGQPRRRKL